MPSGAETGSKGQQTALHVRTKLQRTMAESTGWTRPLSDRLPTINPKGILEFKPQKEFPTTPF